MLLVLDVGNTQIAVGIFEKETLSASCRLHTEPRLTEDELHLYLSHFLRQQGFEMSDVRQTVISCVVPPMIRSLDIFCRKYLSREPIWIGPANVDMPVRYRNPEEVGADRLVNSVAAYKKYCGSVVVIDFGTATTFDCISKEGEYLGGAIAPGIGISAEALFQHASKLPRVELFNPPASVIGKETSESMKAGMLYGYAEMVDGMIRRIKKEMHPDKPAVIATGGLAYSIGEISDCIEAVEPDLTLEGLLLVSRRLSDKG